MEALQQLLGIRMEDFGELRFGKGSRACEGIVSMVSRTAGCQFSRAPTHLILVPSCLLPMCRPIRSISGSNKRPAGPALVLAQPQTVLWCTAKQLPPALSLGESLSILLLVLRTSCSKATSSASPTQDRPWPPLGCYQGGRAGLPTAPKNDAACQLSQAKSCLVPLLRQQGRTSCFVVSVEA